MSKFIFVDKKTIKKRYRLPRLVVSLAFLSISVISYFFWIYNPFDYSKETVDTVLFPLFIAFSISFFLSIVFGFIFTHVQIKAHMINTFIDITSTHLIISELSEVSYGNLKPEYFKRLYVTKLCDLNDIYLKKQKLVVESDIKMYYGKSSWLLYSVDKGGVNFENWWFNYNYTDRQNKYTFKNNYLKIGRVIRLIKSYSKVAKHKEKKRKEYHEQLLKMAKSPVPIKTRRQQIIDKKNREFRINSRKN